MRIWQLRTTDESALSTVLPAEQAAESRPKPWLLHTLPVNTLNFCAFSMCYEENAVGERSSERVLNELKASEQYYDAILIAVPSTDDKKIDVYGMPDEKLRFVVPKVQPIDTGMQAILFTFLIQLRQAEAQHPVRSLRDTISLSHSLQPHA